MAQYCSDSDTDSYEEEEEEYDDDIHSLVYFGTPSLTRGGREEEEEEDVYEMVGETGYHRYYAQVCLQGATGKGFHNKRNLKRVVKMRSKTPTVV